MFRVIYICSECFFTILMVNNKKKCQNNVRMVWAQKEVIMCCFVTFASFRVKIPKLFIVIFLSRAAK